MSVRTDAVRRRLARGGDEFGISLTAAFSVLVLAPFEQHHFRPVIATLLAAMLVFTLWTSGVGHPVLVVAAALSSCAVIVAGTLEAFATPHAARLSFSIIVVVLALAVIVAIVRRLIAHLQVRVRTITGALTVYLLLGLLFCYLFVLVGEVRDTAFFAQVSTGTAIDFLYFSFATLTTVGFGDLTAADSLGRMLSVLEALLGQLYLVTVVALLVGNIGRRREPRRSAARD